ncbi:hypothetical protein [Paenibacillus tengchongensis]|uniref:SunI/YnzG family protein n=1 Tax=Paenibacillus tengchongensis TaxID=2608684 RepID=UPI00124D9597|nr:hypothetical protein [Paenibacillus tengchongensis]
MFGIKVTASNSSLVIRWQLSKFEIPLSDITEVADDNTFGGMEKQAIRIGTPYGSTDRTIIRTKARTYILFTADGASIKDRINDFRKLEK